jgi:uncharacterized membrane protein
MNPSYVLFLAFLIGLLTGLRALTPTAVTAWGAHAGWLKLRTPVLSWLGTLPAAIVFTIFAIVELTSDKLPKTPARTAPPGLISRIMLGAFTGACIAMGNGRGFFLGGILGIVGALAGAFGGYQVRTRLVKALNVPDYVVAVIEDLVTICGSLWVVSRF